MVSKENLKKFIELRVENEKVKEPFYDLIGTEMALYDIIDETEYQLAQALGISEAAREVIDDFAHYGKIRFSDKSFFEGESDYVEFVTEVDRLVDLILFFEETDWEIWYSCDYDGTEGAVS
jgi:hypothetical protein